jgi:hypothetical protein
MHVTVVEPTEFDEVFDLVSAALFAVLHVMDVGPSIRASASRKTAIMVACFDGASVSGWDFCFGCSDVE